MVETIKNFLLSCGQLGTNLQPRCNPAVDVTLARLGVPPEGCSSVHFARIMGEANAERMLGKEGWKPIAHEAKEVGLIKEVVPHDRLLDRLVPTEAMW